MKIAYHQPTVDTIGAYRSIFNGYQNAFVDLGHDFTIYTAGMDLAKFLEAKKPDIFITASHFFWRKQIDYKILRKYRDMGMVVLTKVDFWDSPLLSTRVNEAKSMKDDKEAIDLMQKDLLGDIYFHVVGQGDERMKGFAEKTGNTYITIPLAADKTVMKYTFDAQFEADISFLGTNLPQKREYFKDWLLPLGKKYQLELYGQDWTKWDRTLGNVQKVGQYFNLPILKTIRKPKLKLEDEAKIYSSTKISVNLHEDYQRKYGGDCNERTFKVLACGGFEVTDDVACIGEYLKDGEEIIIARDKADWFEKIGYYMDRPEERIKIARAGQKRVLKEHTYHNRAQQIIDAASIFREKNEDRS